MSIKGVIMVFLVLRSNKLCLRHEMHLHHHHQPLAAFHKVQRHHQPLAQLRILLKYLRFVNRLRRVLCKQIFYIYFILHVDLIKKC